jgi:hypothetical protein
MPECSKRFTIKTAFLIKAILFLAIKTVRKERSATDVTKGQLITAGGVVSRVRILLHRSYLVGKKVKVKQSRYTPWRRLGGEEV